MGAIAPGGADTLLTQITRDNPSKSNQTDQNGMKRRVTNFMKKKSLFVAIALIGLANASGVAAEGAQRLVTVQEARPLSAFFGLDDSLPFAANALCLGAWGKDGMPVVLSHTVNPDSLQADDFRVVRQSGATDTPMCVTLRPAGDMDENRTVLLIGEFGNENDDPPVKVLVIDDLFSDSSDSPQVNFRETEVSVIPLDAGPEIILAAVVPKDIWSLSGRGTSCPTATKQVVRVTWTGGVRLPNRDELSEAQRTLYKVGLTAADGSRSEVSPAVLADLGDADNNHFLCLDTDTPATAVAFPAGHLIDPNGDLNAESKVLVRR